MAQTNGRSNDRFSLWFRFRTTVVYNLLHFYGPAHLENHLDPRAELEEEYEYRRALHRERRGQPPLPAKPPSASRSGNSLIWVMVLATVVMLGIFLAAALL